jgi:hypothetical protein
MFTLLSDVDPSAASGHVVYYPPGHEYYCNQLKVA